MKFHMEFKYIPLKLFWRLFLDRNATYIPVEAPKGEFGVFPVAKVVLDFKMSY